ncbi:hypothetical protein LO772_23950 [Yinghuangia sp. ASG 101]|uniref:hypothetical protein n=1 Tax=Yinghuangia sp. ASG 101 TaxID=2896848 RepID=UPI001E311BD6|nr:hypothetical protein [Yinghuangia sp. ASG 101]UGQ09930.1 hypothetical protein LO772_23950 [Yinghuangia sp. ASG 101]
MTPRRPSRTALLAPFVAMPLLAGCVSGGSGAPEPSPGLPVAVAEPVAPSAPVLPEAAAVARATAGPAPGAAPPATRQPAGDPAPDTAAPRAPSHRPAPTRGTTPTRRPAPSPTASVPAAARETTIVLTADVCQGLAEYGVFEPNGDIHRWCLAQQRAG